VPRSKEKAKLCVAKGKGLSQKAELCVASHRGGYFGGYICTKFQQVAEIKREYVKNWCTRSDSNARPPDS
jgi:hypothetical protein